MPDETLLEIPQASSAEVQTDGANPALLRNAVRFKGWRGGLLISVPADVEWQGAIDGLFERMNQAREFWEGAPCTLDLADREIAAEPLSGLADRLSSEFELSVIGIISQRESVRHSAQAQGIDAHRELPSLAARPSEPEAPIARYLKGTVRSGVVVEATGHLVVLGDVNAGAEVRAGGDIVVFGTLRGVAHAGAQGDLAACILALNLRPTQLRIADLIARAPDGGSPPLSKFPEKAIVEDGEIHVVPA